MEQLHEETATWKEKQAVFGQKAMLKNIMMFNVYGFNSGKFDLAVLISYIGQYAENKDKSMNVLKRGKSFKTFISLKLL